MLESLPRLEGELQVDGLEYPVEIARDDLGIPTLRGESRLDVAFATGFVHAQDRFFQMDLLRRRSAGELAEILGAPAVKADVEVRRHRFRHRVGTMLEEASADARQHIEAYTEGVNAGLSDLQSPPFEYLVLRTKPEPWQQEDTLLVVLTMFLQLQEANGEIEEAVGLMRDELPAEIVAFLHPPGTEWDAPVVGDILADAAIPGPEIMDLRQEQQAATGPLNEETMEIVPGSNALALTGDRTAGGALLGNDLHLNLSVPNIWYRAVFVWPDSESDKEHKVVGVTLPGIPSMVLGSNSQIAWGLTNGVIDTRDLILLETDPQNEDTYLTAEGPKPFEKILETVHVKGASDRTVEVVSTQWGPVWDKDHRGRHRVLRWTAHEKEAVNLESLLLETATNIDEAIEIAQISGIPPMNFFVVDTEGRIGWTIMGRMPQRIGFDGRAPAVWTDGSRVWDGLLPPAEVPRVVDPVSGQLWNGNNRMVDGEMLAKLGDGGYASGARARQLRDGLSTLEKAEEADFLAILLDDKALFLERWRDLLLEVLTPEAIAADPRRGEMREVVENWQGYASVDSASYRLVRTFRQRLFLDLFNGMTAACREVDSDFSYTRHARQSEAPLWALVSQRPLHLLDPAFETWDQQLLAAVDAVIAYYSDGSPLATKTWGRRNTTTIRHPLSQAIPGLGDWLDMPALRLPGDVNMPRVQGRSYGATIRMVVSPGREEEGFLHMPTGQSGHPASPYYKDAHLPWAEGRPTSFLPGPEKLTLVLEPLGS